MTRDRLFKAIVSVVGGLIILTVLWPAGRAGLFGLIGEGRGLIIRQTDLETRLKDSEISRAQLMSDLVKASDQLGLVAELARQLDFSANVVEEKPIWGRLLFTSRARDLNRAYVRLNEVSGEVLVGAALVAPGNVLLGKVRTIEGNLVTVEPLTNASVVLNARAQESGAAGVVKSHLGELLFVTAQSEPETKPGEVILTSGDPFTSDHLLVGLVSKSAADQNFERSTKLEPYFKPSAVDLVFILNP